MTTELNIHSIRGLTRLALPADDGYIYRLGVALYGFASLSSFMAEVAHHMDPRVDRTELQAKTGGHILDGFRASLKKAKKTLPAVGPRGRVFCGQTTPCCSWTLTASCILTRLFVPNVESS